MTPAGELLAARIARSGSVAFSTFMEEALYHPELGYYTRWRTGRGTPPFGKEGDFFTAAQLQPVFGRLIGAVIRDLYLAMGRPGGFRVLDWGAGHEQMREGLGEFDYIPVDVRATAPAAPGAGVIFANEFFDALPVDVALRRGGVWLERRVAFDGQRFRWVETDSLDAKWQEYARWLARDYPDADGELIIELPLRLHDALRAMSDITPCGYLLVIDYGYSPRELVRFPQGSLMSYRRHQASEDVLADPGERDITAHVSFGYLSTEAAAFGWRLERKQNLASLLMDAGEQDQFAAALAAPDGSGKQKNTLLLKTLLFGMGETYQALLFSRR